VRRTGSRQIGKPYGTRKKWGNRKSSSGIKLRYSHLDRREETEALLGKRRLGGVSRALKSHHRSSELSKGLYAQEEQKKRTWDLRLGKVEAAKVYIPPPARRKNSLRFTVKTSRDLLPPVYRVH